MTEPFPHPMLAETRHDELARLKFVQCLKVHLADQVGPATRAVYDREVEPAFKATEGRVPRDRHEVRRVMTRHPYYRMWSALQRGSQRMLWDAAEEAVARQLPDLIERAKPKQAPLGSLTLDPDLEIPRYLSALDIHLMPGSYDQERVADDVGAGAIYDRGLFYYAMSGYGPLNDARGTRIAGEIKRLFPDLKPRRILDIGCTVGHSTLPYVDAFPDAEIHAIDVGAPVLRYAHARAEALGKPVHFSQQNGEATNFPDGHFDLVMSHIVVHETSRTALPRIMKECRRLLAPGGVTAHVDLVFFDGLDPFDAFILDWDTYNNNEPFWGALREMDPIRLMVEAGFAHDKAFNHTLDRDPGRLTPLSKPQHRNPRGKVALFGAQA